jgi:hypothetical protein
MQVAGVACRSCGSMVAFESEGTACRKCEIVFHHRCLKEPDKCPQCLGGIAAMEREAALEEHERGRRLLNQGRTAIRVLIVYYGLILLFELYVGFRARADPYIIVQAATGGAAAIYALLNLRGAARFRLLVVNVIAAIVFALFTAKQSGVGYTNAAVIGGAFLVCQVIIVAVLVASPGIDAYSYSQGSER